MHLKTYLGKLYIIETTCGNTNFLIGPFSSQLYYFILLMYKGINYLDNYLHTTKDSYNMN